MIQHPRVRIVNQAKNEISKAIMEIEQKHDLTEIELLQILIEYQSTTLKYMLREERHPKDPDKPSGLL